jgi:hypothetical protein
VRTLNEMAAETTRTVMVDKSGITGNRSNHNRLAYFCFCPGNVYWWGVPSRGASCENTQRDGGPDNTRRSFPWSSHNGTHTSKSDI